MKLIKKILIFIGLLIIISIAFLIYVGISIFDETNNVDAEIHNNPKSVELLINDYLFDSLENTLLTEKVSLLLSEYETNYLLNAIKDEINIPLVNIKSMYSCYKEDGSVLFEAPFSFFGFNSCLKGNIDLWLDDDGTFNFTLKELSAGKITSNNGVLKFILNNVINLDNICKSLADLGIKITITRNNGEYLASMSKDQMKETINNLLSDNKTDDLVNALIEAFIGDNSLFSLKFNDDNKIGAILYLKDLAYSQKLNYDLYQGINNLNTLKEKLVILFQNKIINYDNLSIVYDYLVRGYEPMTDINKEIIDSIDFSSISINDNKAYDGIIYKSNLTIAKIFLDASTSGLENLTNIILKGYYDITISEYNLNELLNSLDFIGTSFAFISEDNKVANITISSLYTNISNEELTMYLVLDVNGKYIDAKVKASVKENDEAILTLSIDSISLGSKKMNENVTNYLLNYLRDVLVETKFISINPSLKTMSLDFSSYIEGTFFEKLSKLSINKFSITMEDKKLIFRVSNKLVD